MADRHPDAPDRWRAAATAILRHGLLPLVLLLACCLPASGCCAGSSSSSSSGGCGSGGTNAQTITAYPANGALCPGDLVTVSLDGCSCSGESIDFVVHFHAANGDGSIAPTSNDSRTWVFTVPDSGPAGMWVIDATASGSQPCFSVQPTFPDSPFTAYYTVGSMAGKPPSGSMTIAGGGSCVPGVTIVDPGSTIMLTGTASGTYTDCHGDAASYTFDGSQAFQWSSDILTLSPEAGPSSSFVAPSQPCHASIMLYALHDPVPDLAGDDGSPVLVDTQLVQFFRMDSVSTAPSGSVPISTNPTLTATVGYTGCADAVTFEYDLLLGGVQVATQSLTATSCTFPVSTTGSYVVRVTFCEKTVSSEAVAFTGCMDEWTCEVDPSLDGTIAGPSEVCAGEEQAWTLSSTTTPGVKSKCDGTADVGIHGEQWTYTITDQSTNQVITSGDGTSVTWSFPEIVEGDFLLTFTGTATGDDPCDTSISTTVSRLITVPPPQCTVAVGDVTGCPGDTVMVRVSVTNTSSHCDYNLFVATPSVGAGDPHVTFTGLADNFFVPAGQTVTKNFTFAISADSPIGEKTVNVDVTNSSDGNVVSSAGTIVVPAHQIAVTIDPVTSCPGEKVSVPFTITNTGPCSGRFSWMITSKTPGGSVIDQGNTPQVIMGTNGGAGANVFHGMATVQLDDNVPDSGDVELEIVVSTADEGELGRATGIITIKVDISVSPAKKSIAAGGVHSPIHQTLVTFKVKCDTKADVLVDVSLEGGAGSDNSSTWWWGMPAKPASLFINGLTIIANGPSQQTSIGPDGLTGVLTSSNKLENTTIRVSAQSGAGSGEATVAFVPAQFQVTLPAAPVNVWSPVSVNMSLDGHQVNGHLVRMAVSKVTLLDGTVVNAELGGSARSSQSLVKYVQLDYNAFFDHSFFQTTTTFSNPSISTQCRVMDVNVRNFELMEFDMSVENGQ